MNTGLDSGKRGLDNCKVEKVSEWILSLSSMSRDKCLWICVGEQASSARSLVE